MAIQADYREKPSGIPSMLIERKVEVVFASLHTGDYHINRQIGVERKSAEDFVQCIIANRLFEQLSRLKKNVSRPLLLIEGNPYRTNHAIHEQAIRGALLSIAVSWQIPVMFSKNREDSAALLMMVGMQDMKNNLLVPAINGYKPRKFKSRQLFFLQGLPSVGPKLAGRLFDKFGNLRSVINATEKELIETEGIGKKVAKSICEFVTKR